MKNGVTYPFHNSILRHKLKGEQYCSHSLHYKSAFNDFNQKLYETAQRVHIISFLNNNSLSQRNLLLQNQKERKRTGDNPKSPNLNEYKQNSFPQHRKLRCRDNRHKPRHAYGRSRRKQSVCKSNWFRITHR